VCYFGSVTSRSTFRQCASRNIGLVTEVCRGPAAASDVVQLARTAVYSDLTCFDCSPPDPVIFWCCAVLCFAVANGFDCALERPVYSDPLTLMRVCIPVERVKITLFSFCLYASINFRTSEWFPGKFLLQNLKKSQIVISFDWNCTKGIHTKNDESVHFLSCIGNVVKRKLYNEINVIASIPAPKFYSFQNS
jgi:hypothetical protein